MRYTIEPTGRIFGFLSFARNLNNKYGQKSLLILLQNLQQMH